jgi:hypothetical protein
VSTAAKGLVADLIMAYENAGSAALERLRVHWHSATIPRVFVWQATDLTGDGRDELIAVWNGGVENPGLAQVAALAVNGNQLTQLFDRRFSTRDESYAAIVIEGAIDLTNDDRVDVVLRDRPTGRVWVLSVAEAGVALLDVPERCDGSLVARDVAGDGRAEIVRDGCKAPGRVSYGWDGLAFVLLP